MPVLIQRVQKPLSLSHVLKLGNSCNIARKHKHHYVRHGLSNDASCSVVMTEIGMRVASAAGCDRFLHRPVGMTTLHHQTRHHRGGVTVSAAQTHRN